MRSWRNRLRLLLLASLLCLWMAGTAGRQPERILYCMCVPLLLAIGIIDETTGRIPPWLNLAVGMLGMIRLIQDIAHWQEYLCGMLAAGGILYAIYRTSRKKGIGGGDIKLMAAAGLLLGLNKVLSALFIASLLAAAIHFLRMKFFGSGRSLAFGPYLSAGIFAVMLSADRIVQ